jgi:hypothetical protein
LDPNTLLVPHDRAATDVISWELAARACLRGREPVTLCFSTSVWNQEARNIPAGPALELSTAAGRTNHRIEQPQLTSHNSETYTAVCSPFSSSDDDGRQIWKQQNMLLYNTTKANVFQLNRSRQRVLTVDQIGRSTIQ